MEKITSVNNELVKQTVKLQQRKYRDAENKFLLEGYKAISEAYNAGIELECVFVLESSAVDYKFVNDKIVLTTEPVLKKISTTDSAPEAVAVGIQKHFSVSEVLGAQKVLLLEGIKDAGNLGTILRTAAAFGADLVVLYGESVDLYNPKTVRASVGNLWKVPILHVKEFAELEKMFSGYSRVATLPRAKTSLNAFSIKTPYVVMFGSEADGLSDELVKFATDEVKIEMKEDVESLNLSVSCAVVLYKLLN